MLDNDLKNNNQESRTNDVLQISGLKIQYIESRVVTNYGNISIQNGDFVLLKGRNGSGKSTLLKIISNNFISQGKSSPYFSLLEGNVIYKDFGKSENFNIITTSSSNKDITRLRCHIVSVNQNDYFESTTSAYEALFEPTLIALNNDVSLSKEEKNLKVSKLESLIQEFYEGISIGEGETFSLGQIVNSKNKREFQRKKLKAYSGGQQKMVNVVSGLIKTLVIETNLLLLDEPANNLDGKNKYYLNKLINIVRKKNPSLSIIMISHCHVFEGINKIIDVDYAKSSYNEFEASIINKDDPKLTEAQKLKFITHSDCLEDCSLRNNR